MSVTATDFLTSAGVAYAAGSEIDLRNCVSRAYYSVFHHALPVAEAHFADQNANFGMGEHERLSKRFHDGKTRKSVGVGYVLEVMKRQRRRADYDLLDAVTVHDAQQALAQARGFPAQLAQCIPQSVAPPANAQVSTATKK
ncbi:hypothetical protein GIY62_06060 [Burkholderia plantarii]|uniref:hypothetical protein n=1 Tax=Burkholderia plantarii TaxID=41899 RepID=UPI00272BC35D|nr:hypothetical protein [Burkholderia plantarii]WLE60222.1 hypothetical protein GIY62_06060 [Burkholderia plantarii]